jgi:hypothetical protein
MVSPIPNLPDSITVPSDLDIKVATPEIVLINNDSLPIEIMTQLMFESIGGQEIINIARHDTVNGQNIKYQPIKNLSELFMSSDLKNTISIQDTSLSYFKNFSIKLGAKIPETGNAPDGGNVYFDISTGDLVIDLINMKNYEQAEIQIVSSGEVLDDTIY